MRDGFDRKQHYVAESPVQSGNAGAQYEEVLPVTKILRGIDTFVATNVQKAQYGDEQEAGTPDHQVYARGDVPENVNRQQAGKQAAADA